MTDRLHAVLAAAGIDASPEELADVLWLAERMPGVVAPVATPALPAVADSASVSESYDPPLRPKSRLPPELPSVEGHAVYGADAPSPGGRSARPVRMPRPRAMASDLAMTRALRPLRRRVPSHRDFEVDEARTVVAIADHGVLDVTLRPVPVPWLDLALVVDDGVSMRLWRDVAEELHRLLMHLGTFRRVVRYGLDSAVGGVHHKPFASETRPVAPSTVPGRDGRTAVLVVSDGVGVGWHSGVVQRLLAGWAFCGPVAVTQPLPPRLWDGTGIRPERLAVSAPQPGAANARLQVRDPLLPRGFGLPVPVVDLTPEGLGGWARLVAEGAEAVLPVLDVSAVCVGSEPGAPVVGEPGDVLTAFRGSVSPQAYRLAGHLAAVRPLTLPVMRLVQQAVVTGVETAQLAEVFLGGMLRQTAAGPGGATYDFVPGVRELLLDSVPTGEALETAEAVSALIEPMLGQVADFPAVLPDDNGESQLAEGARPFALFGEPVLRRLGYPPTTAEESPALRIIAGRYHLAEQLGEGGEAVVWKAYDTRHDRTVALKEFLHREGDAEQEAFLSEIQMTSRITHTSAIKVFDYGVEDGHPYFTMEFMPGGSLADRIARGPLSAGEVIRIGLEIIEPLAYTHELGIVHRDIKPGNILFNAEGHAILADFGIASRLDGQEVRPDEDLIAITTSLSVPAGTIEYASPEQLQGFPSGPEADLWSLGVTLWHMVTGHSPFRTGNVFQTMFAIVSGGTEVPEELGEFRFLIRSLLSRDPGERMTAAAVEVELRRLWTAAGSGSPTGPPGPPAPPAPPVRPAVRPQPREGDVLAGRYALNHVVSTSGAEVRWEAFDNVLLRHVVAVTPRELATGTEEDSQEPRDRFLRTARVLSQIHHPSVQSIYDVLDHHDRPWAIMELVEGRTLREIITWGPVGLRTTARIGVNVLEALDHIHRTGSVHRDIKPQNIIVAESDEVFLTGFEIARPFNEPPITQTGFAVGSPQYIAPESILGNDEGPAVDVWCLGLTLLAAATGSPPFFGNDSPLQIIRSILEDPIEIPSELGPLRPVLLGMLNKDPSQRPTVEDVQAALLDALNQLP